MLGLRATRCSRGKHWYHVKTLPYDKAVAIARALNVDPVDVGL